MAFYNYEIYYNGISNTTPLSQINISEEPLYGEIINFSDLHEHLQSLEFLYKPYLNANRNKPSKDIVNEIFISCTSLFKHKYDLVQIYSEIIDYFGFNNTFFFRRLDRKIQQALEKSLSKKVNTEKYKKRKK